MVLDKGIVTCIPHDSVMWGNFTALEILSVLSPPTPNPWEPLVFVPSL